MLRKVGVYEKIEPKTTRYANAASVMDHVLKGKGSEIGFAPITEIMLYKDKGLRFVGPLPAEVQQLNTYVASPMKHAANAEFAHTLVRFLGSAAAKSAFKAAGIE
jgi:molybdate transport system substrate-binding protein